MLKPRFTILIACCALAISACAPVKQRERSVATEVPRAEPSAAPAAGTDWRRFTQLELTSRGGAEAVRRMIEFGADGAIRVVVRESTTSSAPAGEMLLVGGQLLFVRGLDLVPGQELEAFDAAMLTQQLAVNLLQEAVPGGPGSVSGARRVDVEDRGDPVGAETTNSSRYYYAPWELQGNVRRIDAESIGFELQFEYLSQTTRRAARARLELQGEWRGTKTAPVFADDFALADWRAFRLRPGTREVAGLTVAGYVAVPETKRYGTLGEARLTVSRPR